MFNVWEQATCAFAPPYAGTKGMTNADWAVLCCCADWARGTAAYGSSTGHRAPPPPPSEYVSRVAALLRPMRSTSALAPLHPPAAEQQQPQQHVGTQPLPDADACSDVAVRVPLKAIVKVCFQALQDCALALTSDILPPPTYCFMCCCRSLPLDTPACVSVCVDYVCVHVRVNTSSTAHTLLCLSLHHPLPSPPVPDDSSC